MVKHEFRCLRFRRGIQRISPGIQLKSKRALGVEGLFSYPAFGRSQTFFLPTIEAGDQGFEPQFPRPERGVLPLHQSPRTAVILPLTFHFLGSYFLPRNGFYFSIIFLTMEVGTTDFGRCDFYFDPFCGCAFSGKLVDGFDLLPTGSISCARRDECYLPYPERSAIPSRLPGAQRNRITRAKVVANRE